MEKQKFYQTTWFMWVCIVLLPPVGLIIVALKKDLEPKKKKTYLIIAAVWCALVLIIGAFSPKKEEPPKPTPTPTVETTPEPTPTPTESTDPSGFTYNDHINFITITQQMSDKYLANYDAPWGESDYTYSKFDDEGAVMVTTQYTFKNDSEKKNVYCIFTYDHENETFKGHYLEVGGKVYMNDGYADAFLQQLQEINDASKE